MTRGRPSKYTEELANRICELVQTHAIGLERLCKMYYDELPNECTIYAWLAKYESFSKQYARAKMKQAELLAQQCLDIADDTSNDSMIDKDGQEVCNKEYIARSRLRIDTRKWLASKLLPRQYGDRQHTEVTINHESDLKDLA